MHLANSLGSKIHGYVKNSRPAHLLAFLAIPCLALAGCGAGSVQEIAGVSRDGPDEFQVVRRAPLIMPPEYNLRPPDESVAQRPNEPTPSVQARELVTGTNGQAGSQLSPGEQVLLAQSSVRADPEIRTVITEDDNSLGGLDQLQVLFILDFQRDFYRPDPEVIDPVKESERLAAVRTNNVSVERVGSIPLDQLDDIAEEDS